MPTLKIKGMTCAHCVAAVTKALTEINGIEEVHVNLSDGRAEFTQTKEVPPESLRQALEKIGFEME